MTPSSDTFHLSEEGPFVAHEPPDSIVTGHHGESVLGGTQNVGIDLVEIFELDDPMRNHGPSSSRFHMSRMCSMVVSAAFLDAVSLKSYRHGVLNLHRAGWSGLNWRPAGSN